MRFIGKKYSNSDHWDEWFENDWFSIIENAAGGEEKVHKLYEDADAYIGLMRDKDGEPWEYWIGEFVPSETGVPEGFSYVDFPEASLGVCWIYGKESEVFSFGGQIKNNLLEAGMQIQPDADGAVWYFERNGCPRYTTPDETGNIILDYCYFVK